MRVFIFQDVEKLPNFKKGGLVIIAENLDDARAMIAETNDALTQLLTKMTGKSTDQPLEAIILSEENYRNVISYPLAGKHDRKIITVPSGTGRG